jgi:hypothetical protein
MGPLPFGAPATTMITAMMAVPRFRDVAPIVMPRPTSQPKHESPSSRHSSAFPLLCLQLGPLP